MKVAILGYEREGQASYEYFKAAGHELIICDQDAGKKVPDGAQIQLGETYLDNLDRFDLLVRTAGLNPTKILEKNPGVADKITSGTDEFMKVCPAKHIIGVTGTKGKGTTSTLIARMLEAAGKKVFLGGNIGLPVLEFVYDVQPDDYVVLELSSFQLSDIKHSPALGVCLMIAPEHLNWHGTMEAYITAKQQLFRWQTPQDTAIYYADNDYSKQIASASVGTQIPYMRAPGALVESGVITIDGQALCLTKDLKLLGAHNWQNVCAAITAVWQITQDVEAIRSVLTTFAGLPHRLEFVREVGGISYYNDSFASTPDAAMAALTAIPDIKVPIIGGFDRQLPIEHFAGALKQNEATIRTAFLIGASAERIAGELTQVGFTNFTISAADSMSAIVHDATLLAEPGDAILLSPGFASFDMFKNFEDRGEQFKKVVEGL